MDTIVTAFGLVFDPWVLLVILCSAAFGLFVGAAVLGAVAPGVTAVFSLRGTMEGMTETVTLLAPAVIGYSLIFHVSRCLYTLDRGRAAVTAT